MHDKTEGKCRSFYLQTKRRMIISVIIPCYNVSRHIEDVIKKLPPEVSWIITVNDCSKDDTQKILLRLQQENKKIVLIDHETNQGVGGAMISSFKRSIELNSDITIKIDGDDQMDSSYMRALIKPILDNKADYTKGNRFRDFKALR